MILMAKVHYRCSRVAPKMAPVPTPLVRVCVGRVLGSSGGGDHFLHEVAGEHADLRGGCVTTRGSLHPNHCTTTQLHTEARPQFKPHGHHVLSVSHQLFPSPPPAAAPSTSPPPPPPAPPPHRPPPAAVRPRAAARTRTSQRTAALTRGRQSLIALAAL